MAPQFIGRAPFISQGVTFKHIHMEMGKVMIINRKERENRIQPHTPSRFLLMPKKWERSKPVSDVTPRKAMLVGEYVRTLTGQLAKPDATEKET